MLLERRSGIDRRSGKDRRMVYDVDYFLNGGAERRTWEERRARRERRNGWERVAGCRSMFVGDIRPGGREIVVERRRHKRFLARDSAFALFGHDTAKLGQIVDVSTRGLAFCYIGDECHAGEPSYVDIFLSDSTFYVEKLPVKTVSDLKIDTESDSISAPMWRRGVKFCDLTTEQESALRDFVLHHTTEEV